MKLVVVTLVERKLEIVPLLARKVVVKRLVEVALVKIPVEGVMNPIGVLLMVPPLMVRPSTTNVSVIELVGRVICPVALKLVVVTLVARILVGLKFVTANVVKNPLVEVMEVPLATPNERLVEVTLPMSEVRKLVVVAKRLVEVILVPVSGPERVPPVRSK